MPHHATILAFETRGRGLLDIGPAVLDWTQAQALTTGLLTLFCRHTSASLMIQENASPEVHDDIEAFLGRLAPEGRGLYRHHLEGPDDMPAHLRSIVTGLSLSIPMVGGRLALGTWQGIYLAEHRRRPHRREVALHLAGV
jgi:secondary thiamine-phosphate synthase enzyme